MRSWTDTVRGTIFAINYCSIGLSWGRENRLPRR